MSRKETRDTFAHMRDGRSAIDRVDISRATEDGITASVICAVTFHRQLNCELMTDARRVMR